MRKYLNFVLGIIAILTLLQCKTYYLRSSNLDKNPNECTSKTCINLNEYDLYIRKHISKNLYYKTNDSTYRTEFQFIFIKGKDALVITTIPSKHIYNQENVYLINKNIPNAHYFNNFYFGTADYKDGKIQALTFTNKENKLVWNLIQNDNILQLESVDKYKNKKIGNNYKSVFVENFIVKNSFSYKVNYEKNKNYQTINSYCEDCKIPVNYNQHRKLNYLKKYINKDRVVKLDLIFSENLNNNNNKMRFNKERIKYNIEEK